MALEYQLSYAGIPFLEDQAKIVRLPTQKIGEGEDAPGTPRIQLPPLKHQPHHDLLDELDRVLPWRYLREFAPPPMPGRTQDRLARRGENTLPSPDDLRINDWYYPPTASRWSVFRGLMTSSMVKELLRLTSGRGPQPFVMKAVPSGNPEGVLDAYTLETDMHLLPPRPLAELGGTFDGLFLVTLVDERYQLHGTPATLRVDQNSTWASLISQLATDLEITITYSAISSVYGQPEPDSQLWSSSDNAPVLLDAIAFSIGRTVVRNLNGTYVLLTHAESAARVATSRGDAGKVVRAAGGDIFYSGLTLPAGSLTSFRNAIVPESVEVTFPKYVQGDDPVPHFVNERYRNQRPSAWVEDAYGSLHIISVGVRSGGPNTTGLSGIGPQYLHTTAKAICSGEIQAASGVAPFNASGLTALAMQLARDLYDKQVLGSLDEVYPGTYAWDPDGFHDLIWTYSPRIGKALTRVMQAEWNGFTTDSQTAGVALSGQTVVPRGVGGPSVAQTWRDSYSGAAITTTLNQSGIASGDTTFTFLRNDNFPTQNRWLGSINQERVLFEGTSGGVAVGAAQRAVDGTLLATHLSGSTITYLRPDKAYGVNLVTAEKMQFVFPSDATSGGIQGINLVPQTQTVEVLGGTPTTIRNLRHYSGRVLAYDTTQASGSEFLARELCWIVERNNITMAVGRRIEGQFVGFSASGPTAPLYLVSEAWSGGGSTMAGSGVLNVREATDNDPIVSGVLILEFLDQLSATSGIGFVVTSGPDAFVARIAGLILSGGVTSGLIGNAAVLSGSLASGIVGRFALASGAVNSGHIGNTAVVSGSLASGIVGRFALASGAVNSGHIGNNAVTSGNYASGSVSDNILSSGAVRSGHIAQASVLSGTLASGATGNNLLDGFFHFDTVAGSPAIGVLPVGNSGGLWQTFPTGNSGQILTVAPESGQGLIWKDPATAAAMVVNHFLLVPPTGGGSGQHTDVVSGAASVGVIVAGNSGGLWQRFSAPNSGQVLTGRPDLNQGLIWAAPFSGAAAASVVNHFLLVPPTGGGSGQHTDTVSGAPIVGSLVHGAVGSSGWMRLSGHQNSGRLYLSQTPPDATASVTPVWEQVRSRDVRFLGCKVSLGQFSGAIALVSSGVNVVSWTNEEYDIGGFHGNSGSRLTAPIPGYYRTWGRAVPSFIFGAGVRPSGYVRASLLFNGAGVIDQDTRVLSIQNYTDADDLLGAGSPYVNTSLFMVAGDYVEIRVENQTSIQFEGDVVGGQFGIELLGAASGVYFDNG